ncbi:hypothetical protein SCHIN_v1c02310 [Spiroplasma chinense]|uniref:Uncharacterized protein n=1 Tax=Spiroplasma chinense TaxID=216932 RepID=A0A5B9Y2X7_9MOLU|nr:hypothetical protein [Spiroplasma chinense]QEH61428.1 hypothetical protein SCHIN_v1c02310 [Spiroplasma chinense]
MNREEFWKKNNIKICIRMMILIFCTYILFLASLIIAAFYSINSSDYKNSNVFLCFIFAVIFFISFFTTIIFLVVNSWNISKGKGSNYEGACLIFISFFVGSKKIKKMHPNSDWNFPFGNLLETCIKQYWWFGMFNILNLPLIYVCIRIFCFSFGKKLGKEIDELKLDDLSKIDEIDSNKNIQSLSEKN